MAESSEWMTATQARDYLGIGKSKLAELIQSGVLPAEDDPLDKRTKKVRRADVEALKKQSPERKPRKNAA